MNIDIRNIGHYRVTSHGGRSYELFDREKDVVISLKKHEWEYIFGSNENAEARCHDLIRWSQK